MNTKLKNGISLITCCMDRYDNLISSLESWLHIKEINEIIIVNWNSEKFDWDAINKLDKQNRVKCVNVTNEKYWILTHAYNLASEFVTYDKLLKIDCDIKLNSNFLVNHKLNSDIFFRGNYRTIKNKKDFHLNGQFFCETNDYKKVNGFNENILTYGYDDEDLYSRLGTHKKEVNINEEYLIHQSHDHRQKNSIECLYNHKLEMILNMLDTDEQKMTYRNELFCKHIKWNSNSKKSKWNINEVKYQHYICERISPEIVYMDYNKLNIKIDSVHIKKFYHNLKKWKFSKMNCIYDDFFDEQKFKEELKQKIDYVN